MKQEKYIPTLILPIKRQWFDMIAEGEKKEEYRDIKPYYRRRLFNAIEPKFRNFDFDEFDDALRQEPENFRYVYLNVLFRNGYDSNAPAFLAECWLGIGKGRERWGAVPGEEYYILHIENVYKEWATGISQTGNEKFEGWVTAERPYHILLFNEKTGNNWICRKLTNRRDRTKLGR